MKKISMLVLALATLSNYCKTALISVSDKTHIVDFSTFLLEQGYTIISTGGTHRCIYERVPKKFQKNIHSVEDITQFPEILSGRVKTLHPAIHGGILAVQDDPTHKKQLKTHGIKPIDLVVVNLYPFKKTITDPHVTQEKAIENIDIGGFALIRAAAKNFKYVTTIVDPQDYYYFMKHHTKLTEKDRKELAQKVFEHTKTYDEAIASFLAA